MNNYEFLYGVLAGCMKTAFDEWIEEELLTYEWIDNKKYAIVLLVKESLKHKKGVFAVLDAGRSEEEDREEVGIFYHDWLVLKKPAEKNRVLGYLVERNILKRIKPDEYYGALREVLEVEEVRTDDLIFVRFALTPEEFFGRLSPKGVSGAISWHENFVEEYEKDIESYDLYLEGREEEEEDSF